MANIGVSIPSPLPAGMSLPDIAGLARQAEMAGLDCIWAEDLLAHGDAAVLDIMCVLAAAAAATETIEIGSAVFVPSLRSISWALKTSPPCSSSPGAGFNLGWRSGPPVMRSTASPASPARASGSEPTSFLALVAACRGEMDEVAGPRAQPCHSTGYCVPGAAAVGWRDVLSRPSPCGSFGTAGCREFRPRPSSTLL